MPSWKTNTIMLWDNNKISDHGRAELSIDTEQIDRKDRMLDGTMRRYFTTIKHNFSTSWNNLPSTEYAGSGPVDGGWTGPQMKDFIDATVDPFTLTIKDGQGNPVNYLVYVESFTWDIAKRGPNVDLWNISVELVEV